MKFKAMPNYIKNRITLIGAEERVKELVEKYSTTYPSEHERDYGGNLIYKNEGMGRFGWLNESTNVFSQRDCEDVIGVPDGFKPSIGPEWTIFPDFNKIVPMPESLNIEIGHNVLTAAKKAQSVLEFSEEEMKLYQICIDNAKKYGHLYWYTWAIENWGTKWNVFSCNKKEDNIFEFETAWNNVANMIGKIAEEFKDVKIEYEWADEDTGYNCGTVIFENGEIVVNRPEGGSKEAYELAFKLRPDRIEDYVLIDGNYKYKEE